MINENQKIEPFFLIFIFKLQMKLVISIWKWNLEITEWFPISFFKSEKEMLFVSLFVFVPVAQHVRTCISPIVLWAINLKICFLFIYLFIYLLIVFIYFFYLFISLLVYSFVSLFNFVTASLLVRVYTTVFMGYLFKKKVSFFSFNLFIYSFVCLFIHLFIYSFI